MARKSSSTFKDRGNNGWGDKKYRINKNQPEVKITMVLDLTRGGKIRFEKVYA